MASKNPWMLYLDRLWDDVADRFGIGSTELDDMSDIIDYWEKRLPIPPKDRTDESYHEEIDRLKDAIDLHRQWTPDGEDESDE